MQRSNKLASASTTGGRGNSSSGGNGGYVSWSPDRTHVGLVAEAARAVVASLARSFFVYIYIYIYSSATGQSVKSPKTFWVDRRVND